MEAVEELSAEERAKLVAFIDELESHRLKQQRGVTEEFAASMERGKEDIAQGNVRVREPEQA